MRLYLEVVRATARRSATYRSATVAGVFTNTIFGFILAYVLMAVFAERGGVIGTFDTTDAVTFTFVTQGLLVPVGMFGDREQAEGVRTGQVAMELSRPYDYQGWWMAVAYGKALFTLLARGIPPFAVAGLVFDLRLPARPITWLWFVVAATLAVGVAAAFGFLVNSLAFWLLDVRGPSQLLWFTAQFLSGVFIPLVLFPDVLLGLVRALPFAAMIQLPVEVFLEIPEGTALIAVWARQALWLVVLVLAGRLLLARAIQKVVIQGG